MKENKLIILMIKVLEKILINIDKIIDKISINFKILLLNYIKEISEEIENIINLIGLKNI
jgi:hypothetical protein